MRIGGHVAGEHARAWAHGRACGRRTCPYVHAYRAGVWAGVRARTWVRIGRHVAGVRARA